MSELNRHDDKNLRKKLIGAYIISFLSGLLVIFLFVYLIINTKSKETAEENRTLVTDQERLTSMNIKEALDQRRDAIIQKRIAEQQQQIAQQQQMLAERQRLYAVKEHLHALEQARIAKKEKNKADSAKAVAIMARDEAEKQKKQALIQKEIAEKEKKRATMSEENANRLMMLSVARSLAIQASELSEGKKQEIARVLALNSFYFNLENGGDIMDPEIYESLLKTSNSNTVLNQHIDAVRGVCFSQSDTKLASCGDDGKVIVWDLNNEPAKAQNLRVKNPSKVFFRCVAFYHNYLIAGTENNKVYFWKQDEFNATAEIIESHNSRVEGLAYDSAYQLLYTSGSEGVITGWNFKNKRIFPIVLDSLNREVNDLDFSDRFGLLACACERGDIILKHCWKKIENTSIKTESPVRSVCFSDNANYLAAGLGDGTIKIYNTKNPDTDHIEIHGRHSASVTKLIFLTDSLIASVSYDGLIKIGPVFIDQNESITINLHNGWVYDITLSDNGKYVASCDANKTVLIIPVDPYLMIEKLMREAGRNLSKNEWDIYVGDDIERQKIFSDKP